MFNQMTHLKQQDQFKGIIFIGTVVSNIDSSQLERVTVRIPHVHDGIPDADLPLCIPMIGRVQGGTGSAQWFGVPPIGASLYVEFQGGDPHFPVYIGGVVSSTTKSGIASTNYPNRWGWVDNKGNIFYSDTLTGDVQFTHYSGTQIHILPSGEVDVSTSGNAILKVTGKATVTTTGDVDISAGGACTVSASSTLNLTSTGSVNISGSSISLN